MRLPYWRWRRRMAVGESRALRFLVCAHGRLPTYGATDWWAAWLDAQLPVRITGAAKCGTRSGYNRHYERGEPKCDECKAANAAYARTRRSE